VQTNPPRKSGAASKLIPTDEKGTGLVARRKRGKSPNAGKKNVFTISCRGNKEGKKADGKIAERGSRVRKGRRGKIHSGREGVTGGNSLGRKAHHTTARKDSVSIPLGGGESLRKKFGEGGTDLI